MQRCVIRCSENAAKCNAISVLCIWISDKKESDKMKTIDDDIRSGNFKQIYLLYGTEAYLKKQYKDKLKNAPTPRARVASASVDGDAPRAPGARRSTKDF